MGAAGAADESRHATRWGGGALAGEPASQSQALGRAKRACRNCSRKPEQLPHLFTLARRATYYHLLLLLLSCAGLPTRAAQAENAAFWRDRPSRTSGRRVSAPLTRRSWHAPRAVANRHRPEPARARPAGARRPRSWRALTRAARLIRSAAHYACKVAPARRQRAAQSRRLIGAAGAARLAPPPTAQLEQRQQQRNLVGGVSSAAPIGKSFEGHVKSIESARACGSGRGQARTRPGTRAPAPTPQARANKRPARACPRAIATRHHRRRHHSDGPN